MGIVRLSVEEPRVDMGARPCLSALCGSLAAYLHRRCTDAQMFYLFWACRMDQFWALVDFLICLGDSIKPSFYTLLFQEGH